jgi:hypothetical protein
VNLYIRYHKGPEPLQGPDNLSSNWACYNFQVFLRIHCGHVISADEGSLCLRLWCFMGPN